MKSELALKGVPVFAMVESTNGLNGTFAYVLSTEKGTVESGRSIGTGKKMPPSSAFTCKRGIEANTADTTIQTAAKYNPSLPMIILPASAFTSAQVCRVDGSCVLV